MAKAGVRLNAEVEHGIRMTGSSMRPDGAGPLAELWRKAKEQSVRRGAREEAGGDMKTIG